MSTIPKLEEFLVAREIQSLNAELIRGLAIIGEAFKKYRLVPVDRTYSDRSGTTEASHEQLKEFDEYVNHLKIASNYYYGGAWFAASTPQIRVDQPPEFIRRVLASYACAEFLKKFDSIDEIRSAVENLGGQP